MPKFREFADDHYVFKLKNGAKHTSTIHPNQRTLENLPRDSKGNPKVGFHEWLGINGEKVGKNAFVGKGHDGKWYGWNDNRAFSFEPGQRISGPSLAKNVYYKKNERGIEDRKNPVWDDDFEIEDSDHAKFCATNFATNSFGIEEEK